MIKKYKEYSIDGKYGRVEFVSLPELQGNNITTHNISTHSVETGETLEETGEFIPGLPDIQGFNDDDYFRIALLDVLREQNKIMDDLATQLKELNKRQKEDKRNASMFDLCYKSDVILKPLSPKGVYKVFASRITLEDFGYGNILTDKDIECLKKYGITFDILEEKP